MMTGTVRERESACGGGTREDRNTKIFLLWLGSNPGRLCGRLVLYPLQYAPRASKVTLMTTLIVKYQVVEEVEVRFPLMIL